MHFQKLYVGVFAVIILGILGVAVFKLSPVQESASFTEQPVTSVSTSTIATTTVSAEEVTTNPSPSHPTDTEQAKPVEPNTSTYSMQQLALHNNASSCWTTINGEVYDLTGFISKHPGGEKNILKICGKDGTSLFEGQHGGESRPEATLEKYYLGPLSN